MSTFNYQDQNQTAKDLCSNSTAISIPTAVNLQSRRSNKIETQEEQYQKTTRNKYQIPAFDYSLLEPAPKTGFDWIKLIFRQYRTLGTRYKTELIAGRILSVLANWLPESVYTNIQSFVQLQCPPVQMPSPQRMNDNKKKQVSKKKKKCGETGFKIAFYCMHEHAARNSEGRRS